MWFAVQYLIREAQAALASGDRERIYSILYRLDVIEAKYEARARKAGA